MSKASVVATRIYGLALVASCVVAVAYALSVARSSSSTSDDMAQGFVVVAAALWLIFVLPMAVIVLLARSRRLQTFAIASTGLFATICLIARPALALIPALTAGAVLLIRKSGTLP